MHGMQIVCMVKTSLLRFRTWNFRVNETRSRDYFSADLLDRATLGCQLWVIQLLTSSEDHFSEQDTALRRFNFIVELELFFQDREKSLPQVPAIPSDQHEEITAQI